MTNIFDLIKDRGFYYQCTSPEHVKDLLNKPISEVTFNLKSTEELDEVSKFLAENGETSIRFKLSEKENDLHFQLENKRSIDRKSINLLRNKEISSIIS